MAYEYNQAIGAARFSIFNCDFGMALTFLKNAEEISSTVEVQSLLSYVESTIGFLRAECTPSAPAGPGPESEEPAVYVNIPHAIDQINFEQFSLLFLA